MARTLETTIAARDVRARIIAQAAHIRDAYGPEIGWAELVKLLADRSCVPFPCEVCFDDEPLLPGEFAHALPAGLEPKDGWTIYVHPSFQSQLSSVPYLVLHQLVRVNFGEAVTADEAELFGAVALGLSKEAYYAALCQLSEQVGGDELL